MAVADQATVSFRVFTDLPGHAPAVGRTLWTSAGPGPIGGSTTAPRRSGRVSAASPTDPSDPSGNTVYVGGASGGIWKTTDFLTSSANGPTWIPLTDFGPTSDNNIGGLAIFGVNNDPNQSMIFAATGDSSPRADRDAPQAGKGLPPVDGWRR